MVYNLGMLIEKLRKEIKNSGKSRYQISKETGIEQAVLCRIMQGGSCKVETADILLDYFGYEVKKKTNGQDHARLVAGPTGDDGDGAEARDADVEPLQSVSEAALVS